MYNKFEEKEGSVKQLEEEETLNSISISNCQFAHEENDDSSGMIYYVSGKDGSEVEINECKFKGKLTKGSHYIESQLKEPKLHIKSCEFESEEKDSINIELINENNHKEMEFDLSSQFMKIDRKIILQSILCLIIFSAFVFTILLIFKKVHNNDSSKEECIWRTNINVVESNESVLNDLTYIKSFTLLYFLFI